MNAETTRSPLRNRLTVLPGIVAAVIVVFWGVDLAVRTDLSSGQFVWLLLVATALALLSLPLLLPLTMLLDRLARGTAARTTTYVATFGAIGVGVGLATDVVSTLAAVSAGVAAGLLAAALTRSPS